jgi:cellulose synthase/poly-beta-1,6-N-acetylglucosamine synthase-like glycosyltransferase
VVAVGGFGRGTLAEDADLTISVRRLGRRIVFEDRAIAWTEAPDTVGAFVKQRRRWSYGTLQVLWKHRDVLLRPRFGALGMVAFPSALLYLGLSLVGPVMDVGAVWFLLTHVLETVYFNHEGPVTPASIVGSFFWSDGPTPVFYYAAFILTEWAQSILAFRLDRESMRPLISVPVQRFALRWLMYFVLFATFLTALKGLRVGWGKLERSGVTLGPVATPTPSSG